MIRISYRGEEMFVHSVAGMDGCTILDPNAAEPSPVSETGRLNGMTKAALFDEIVSELQANGVITALVASKMRGGPSSA
jgi:hypothetical protein